MDRNLVVNYEEGSMKQQRSSQAEREKKLQEQQEGAAMFVKLAPASLLYAAVYAFCIYQNPMGITIPVWSACTIAYVCYAVRRLGGRLKKGSVPCMAFLLLLGISTFTTGNGWIVSLNNFVFFLLLVGVVLHNFREDEGWDFGSYFREITRAIIGACGHAPRPFTDGNAFIKARERGKDNKARYVIFGLCLAAPCILFLCMILMAADMVFANLVEELFSNFRLPEKMLSILFLCFFGFFSAYCGISYAARGTERNTKGENTGWEPVLAITVTALIGLLYLAFCGIQAGYLFAARLQLPDGITYAEYARSGFFQLLFICVLNLILVLWVKKHFLKSRLLDIILLVISACTLVMTASSAFRMALYIAAYQLTFLRAAVLTALAAIALLMAGAMIFIARPGFSFFRYGAAVTGSVYLIFSFAHVDYFIASYNLSQIDREEASIDYEYLSGLSTDAAPAVAAYIRKQETKQSGHRWYRRYLLQNAADVTQNSFRNFNLSHALARDILEDFAEVTDVK